MKSNPENENKLFSGVLWLNAKVLGLALGLMLGSGLFVATNWLVNGSCSHRGPMIS